MAIALFGCAKGTNVIVQLDDPTVVTDEGAAMVTPYFVAADADFGPAGGQGRLRRIVQAVTVAGNVTVTVTPVANGAALADQAQAFALTSSAGTEQRIESDVASMATRHAVRVELSGIGAPTTFGESDLVVVPRRSREHA